MNKTEADLKLAIAITQKDTIYYGKVVVLPTIESTYIAFSLF